ncbi:MAG: SemiSWEET family transporter [Agriterribacter sp.]
MTFEAVISTLTVIASLAVKLIGAPSQIKLLLKTKNSQNISVLQWILVVTSYVLWLLHGIVKNDITVIIGQGIGVLTSGVILFFIVKFRKKNA